MMNEPVAHPVEIEAKVTAPEDLRLRRRRLPDERRAITHKFQIGGHQGYITVGLYDDGLPGEIFVTMAKEGSVISGLMDAFATAISIGLQYGVPLPVLVDKFVNMRFEPSGFTSHPQIPKAKSIIDYLFRWMGMKFLSRESQASSGMPPVTMPVEIPPTLFDGQSDAPACDVCGSLMVRNATFYKCHGCGAEIGN